MRIIIIGAVAAGTSAAAKARRNSEEAEIVIYEQDTYISYSGCGMPYYIGDEVDTFEALVPRDPAFFKSKYQVDILTQHKVMKINKEQQNVEVKNLVTGEIFTDAYDELVIATGATAFIPPIKGADQDHVFSLRTINDMARIKAFIQEKQPKSAAIIGTGFIGLEVCENLKHLGLQVTLIEKLPQVTPGLDGDMACYVKDYLKKQQVDVLTQANVTEIGHKTVQLEENKEIEAEMVLIATGVRPNVSLAVEAGVELGVTGAIKVNDKMQTNVPHIWSCGDCIEHKSVVTGQPIYRPLGSTANKTGRIAGDAMTGGTLSFRGILGTGIFKVFDMVVAQTGLSEREAKELGYEVVVCHNTKPNKPTYMKGQEMLIKGVADQATGRLLGVQIVGFEGVDKRIDVFATAMTYKASVEDLFHLDLAYAPPFSTTKDPVMYTGMILDNAIEQGKPLMTVEALEELKASGRPYTLIDARIPEQYNKHHIELAKNMPHKTLREQLESMDKEVVAITYCNKGVTGNAAQNILLNRGVKEVYNLSGGHKHYSALQATHPTK